MAKSPRKNFAVKGSRASKAPGKTILPMKKKSTNNTKLQQRRFSLLDSDSSELSEFESEENNDEDAHGRFQAIQSESEDEDEQDSDEDLWQNHNKQVVNTSSEEDENEDDDEEEDDSSSSDDDEDYVKLTAERKKKSLEQYRSSSPFKTQSPMKKKQQPMHDVDFSFDFSNGDHLLKIQDEEEDVGEELSGMVSPLRKEVPMGEPLGLVNIQDSDSDEDDIDKDELLRTLEQDSEDLDTGFDTGEDDYNLLQEEAQNIVQDYNAGDSQFSNQTTPRNSVVEEMIKKHKQDEEVQLQYVSDDDDDGYDDDDDDYDEDQFITYFDDSVFRDKLIYTSEGAINQMKQRKSMDMIESDDDSYLWTYFFTNNEESEDGAHPNDHAIISDDEATDEDTTLPPPSSRKNIGSKAQELLSSSTIIARPPALGTWSTDSKPFGIIDGLSTRSLLPSSSTSNNNDGNTQNSPLINTAIVEDFTLDELLNMSELEDDELDHEQWLEATSSNNTVPLSAFRNKGLVMNEDVHLNARRFSNTAITGNKLKPKKLRNEVMSTPLRTIIKPTPAQGSMSLGPHQRKRRGSKMRRRQSVAEAAGEGLRVTRSGLFSEDTLTNVEEFLNGLGNEKELSMLFREIQ